jgi:type VI secretion system protein ImpF
MSQKLTPTLFDKLASGLDMAGLTQTDDSGQAGAAIPARENLRFYTVPALERFNEQALRATVRRDLAWLLNTINLGSLVDLTAYPQVKTSVLNFGVGDLTGKATSAEAIGTRALRIEDAILAFEPRMTDLSVVANDLRDGPQAFGGRRQNADSYEIHGNVTGAVKAMPVRFITDVEVDTGAAVLRD